MTDENNIDTDESLIRSSTMDILRNLTAREAKVLREKFGIELTNKMGLAEVGKQFLVTRQRIREIEKKALKKLRNRNDDDDPSVA